ncbi:hypothetical protein BDN70DRAFT_899003 [Pholiota conissans]|uniref:Transmembrane protein n=1 Tax=Pholiota conissans TaxID=109636 RepID=A0A9P5YRV9_9AGAR|nr:hypothetical protein BDN70DRAFT_899003 [Pholiota conissans]
MTTAIMIDDTDSGLRYSGSWTADKGSLDNLGNFGAPYMSTSHYTKGTGSVSFTFSGTYVGVFGSSVDGKDPSRTCTVDGSTIPNNQIGFAVNMIMHCQVYNLSDGPHTITVTVPTANPNGYWFDYLMYIPSASVSRTNAALMVLWNDPSLGYGTGWTQSSPGEIARTNGASVTVQFTGRSLTWFGYYLSQFPAAATTATYTIDGGNPMSFDLNGIQSQSTGAELNQRFFTTGMLSAGQHTLKVTYNGNGDTTPLSIYNLVVQNGASAGISVGGQIGASHPVSTSNSGGNTGGSTGTGAGSGIGTTAGSGSSPSSPSSTSPPSTSVMVIGSGASAVTVTVSNSSSTATAPADGFGFGTSVTTSPSSSTTTGSNPASSDKTSSDKSSSDSSSGNSSNSSGPSSASDSSHNHLGAILGAVIGVLALLLLALLVFLFLRRRNRKRRNSVLNANNNPSHINLVAQPFTARPTSIPPAMSEISPSEHSGSSVYAPVPTTQFYSDIKRPIVGGASSGPLDPTSMWRSQGASSPSSASHQPSRSISTFSSPANATDAAEQELIMLHEDSGVRIPMGQITRPGLTVVEMPPTYSAT